MSDNSHSEPKLVKFIGHSQNHLEQVSQNNEQTSSEIPTVDRPNYDNYQKTLQNGNTRWSSSVQVIESTCQKIVKNITVEPYLLMSIIAFGLTGAVAQNLILYKFCIIDYGFPEDVCQTLKQNETLENLVQEKATDFQLYKTCITTVPSILLVLCMGSWSDKNGRKFIMLMPCIGGFLYMIVFIINVYFMGASPYYTLLAEVAIGLTGSMGAMSLSSVSYITDISTEASRTVRIGLMQASIMCGLPIGILIGGVIYAQFGYMPVFVAGASMYILAFVYVYFVIKETITPVSKTFAAKVVSFFDLTNFKVSFQACFKKREQNHRVHIICLIIAMMINILPMMAEYSISYYYVRLKFNWDVDTYSYYNTTALLCYMLGLLVFLPLFTRFKVSDVYIGILGAGSRVCSEIIMALAPKNQGWIIFAASPVVVFGGLISPIVRSMLSKCIGRTEQGKVMSVVGAFESGMPLLGSAIYTQVFNATRWTFPGAFYLISAGLCLITVTLFIWISRDFKKHEMTASNINPREDVANTRI